MARRAQRFKTLKLFLPLCPSRLRSGLCSFLFLCVLCGKLSICFLISPSYAVENQDNPSSNSLNSYIEQFYEYKYKTANEVTAQSLLQQRAIPLTLLPRDKYDLIDWAGAVRSGIISPLSSIDGLQEDDDPIDLLISIKAKNEFMTDVIFPHSIHTYWLSCKICHPGIFVQKKGGNPEMTMWKILSGEYCGRCHGKIAFPLRECYRCHMERLQKDKVKEIKNE